ncbi:hypothetical protein GCM10020254_81880 [Streptomyces goshikiensis]
MAERGAKAPEKKRFRWVATEIWCLTAREIHSSALSPATRPKASATRISAIGTHTNAACQPTLNGMSASREAAATIAKPGPDSRPMKPVVSDCQPP